MIKVLPVDKIIHGFVDDFGCITSIIFPKQVVVDAAQAFIEKHKAYHTIYDDSTGRIVGDIRAWTFDVDGDLSFFVTKHMADVDFTGKFGILNLLTVPSSIYQTYINDATGSSMNVITVKSFEIDDIGVSHLNESRFLTGQYMSPEGYRVKRFDEF